MTRMRMTTTMMKQDHQHSRLLLFSPRQATLLQWPSLGCLLWLARLGCIREDIKARNAKLLKLGFNSEYLMAYNL